MTLTDDELKKKGVLLSTAFNDVSDAYIHTKETGPRIEMVAAVQAMAAVVSAQLGVNEELQRRNLPKKKLVAP